MLQPRLFHIGKVPHHLDWNPCRRAWSSKSSGFTPWYGFRLETLLCLPGWEPFAAVRQGRRQGSRLDSSAWTIRAVTSSRIWVWLVGMVESSMPCTHTT